MVIELIKPDEIEKFVELRNIFIDVFDLTVPALDEEQLKLVRDNRNFVAIGATVGFELAGGLTAHIVPNYYRGGLDLFVYDVAIKPSHQGKGVGVELLNFAKKFCTDHKIKEMHVAVKEDDQNAMTYYSKTGAKEMEGRFFTYRFE